MTSSPKKITRLKKEALDWLAVLHSQSRSKEEERLFYNWLNSDPDHQKAFILADDLWKRGGALSEISSVTKSKKIGEKFSFLGFPGMAYLCLFITFSYLILNLPEDASIYQTQRGERQVVSLYDGSTITLNTDSNIEVPTESSTSRKVVLTRGEVYFDVFHDKNRPFNILTEDGLIVVLGTKFSVQKKKNETIITVTEGKVRLIPGAKKWNNKSPTIELTANQQASLTLDTNIKKVDGSKLLSWKEGLLNFEGEPLTNVISELNRYYSPKIQLSSKSLGSRSVIAVLPLSNELDKNLASIKASLGLDSQLSEDESTIILYPKRKSIP